MRIDSVRVSISDIERIDISAAAAAALSHLSNAYKTLACAESCTGGLFGASVTEISGASAVFLGGVISYTNEVKMGMLGVSEKTLDTYGAVSEYTACEMAIGAKSRLGADIGVSFTGYAGPTGGDDKNPVGTVFVCISDSDGERVVKLSFDCGIDRESIRRYSVYYALVKLA